MKKLKLFLALLCTVFLCQTANAEEVTVDEIEYSIDASAKTASVIANSYSGDIVIPASFTYEGVDYSVTSIDNYAFYNCSDLTGIKIPSSITEIGQSAFIGCANLESISVSEENTVYDSRNNCDAVIETATNTLIAGCKKTVIPNSITSIGYGAFCACTDITSVAIPSSVTEIGDYAFSGCTGLTSVVIPNSVTSIGYGAFSGTGLTDIKIPSSVTSIGDRAFSSTGLTDVEIPGSVNEIGKEAFDGCSNLESLTVSKENTVYDSRNNCNAIVETASNTLVAGCKKTVIPNSVTSIGYGAFSGTGLTDIKIPSSVTSIGDWAFSSTGLTDVEIPNSVTSIGNYAFRDTGLTSIEIPSSVTEFGESVFLWCDYLESISVSEENTVYDSRNNCNAIIETATNTLVAGCKNTVIPNSVTSIGDDAFAYCSGLTDIEIPSSVTSIGSHAFSNCEGLTSIVIPSSVTSIGSMAFFGCYNLKSVTSLNPTPPSQSYLAFPSWQATLYVPTGSADAYKNASYWGWAFLNIVEIDVTAIETVACDGKETGTDIYDLSGRRLSAPKKGINIINGRKVLVR